MQVVKRDLSVVDFSVERIENVLRKAGVEESEAKKIANRVEEFFYISGAELIKIDEVQDIIVKYLEYEGLYAIRDHYLSYMTNRNEVRKKGADLVAALGDIINSTHSSMKENANVNADGPMGKMLKAGSAASKEVFLYNMPKKFSKTHAAGDIHIHDLEFYNWTMTCCQIDLKKLFSRGFGTGHGRIREPNRIGSYASLACIAIQSNQNDQHGGQSVPLFDYYLAPGVIKSFQKNFRDILINDLNVVEELRGNAEFQKLKAKNILNCRELNMSESAPGSSDPVFQQVKSQLKKIKQTEFASILVKAYQKALTQTDEDTYQAMEAVVHNLNTMHSRAGAQVPFSSINYGTDTSLAGRLVTRNILLALEAGMGEGEIPIFPIHIFKVKSGINYEPGTPNYDLFQLACRVTSKRMFPNYAFLDAPYNLQYYKQGKPETEVVYMGCRTRVIGNVHDPEREIVTGRGNLSFTSVNLPRIAITSEGNLDKFWLRLQEVLDLVREQLLHRLSVVSALKAKNFPFLMGQGIWIDSESLDSEDEVREVLKHGTLSIGFIGLAETLKVLTGKHHGESDESQKLGIEIVKKMRAYCDQTSLETKLNFTLIATPAEGLSGRFLEIDKKKFGVITDVTSHAYYTNSFHIPVYFPINMVDKIRLEAPYHALCNAGHISYVEVEGAVHNNPEAIESIVRIMYDQQIGYGGINHPVDCDPLCGYSGVIGDTCPQCGRVEGEVPFRRIRRVTGYLAGSLERFNAHKIAEVAERSKHDNEVARKSNS